MRAESVSDRVTGFEDWLPTILDLIGAPTPIPLQADGLSFAPTLLGETEPPRPFLYREFPGYGGQQCVRVGDWKEVRQNLLPRSPNRQPRLEIELYGLAQDPGETTDVSSRHPDIVRRIEQWMASQHTVSPDFPMPAID